MLLGKVKTALRIASDEYDGEIGKLIEAAFADLGITDIKNELLTAESIDPLVERAVTTYCKMNFGYLGVDQYQKFKASYDEQKAQMLMSSTYTNWGGSDA